MPRLDLAQAVLLGEAPVSAIYARDQQVWGGGADVIATITVLSATGNTIQWECRTASGELANASVLTERYSATDGMTYDSPAVAINGVVTQVTPKYCNSWRCLSTDGTVSSVWTGMPTVGAFFKVGITGGQVLQPNIDNETQAIYLLGTLAATVGVSSWGWNSQYGGASIVTCYDTLPPLAPLVNIDPTKGTWSGSVVASAWWGSGLLYLHRFAAPPPIVGASSTTVLVRQLASVPYVIRADNPEWQYMCVKGADIPNWPWDQSNPAFYDGVVVDWGYTDCVWTPPA